MKKRRFSGRDLAILLLCAGLLVTASAAVWALFFRQGTPILAPDHAPQETDANASAVGGDDEGLVLPEGSDSLSLEYSEAVSICLADGEIVLDYTNPARSRQNVVLQVLISGHVIAQSELILPGYRLERLALPEASAEVLAPGVYEDSCFRVLCFDPDTGEQAMVDIEAKIRVTVTE